MNKDKYLSSLVLRVRIIWVTLLRFLLEGLDRTEHMSFLSGQNRTPKFAGPVLPDRTKSGPRLFPSTYYLRVINSIQKR